jgi:hypothetical protein
MLILGRSLIRQRHNGMTVGFWVDTTVLRTTGSMLPPIADWAIAQVVRLKRSLPTGQGSNPESRTKKPPPCARGYCAQLAPVLRYTRPGDLDHVLVWPLRAWARLRVGFSVGLFAVISFLWEYRGGRSSPTAEFFFHVTTYYLRLHHRIQLPPLVLVIHVFGRNTYLHPHGQMRSPGADSPTHSKPIQYVILAHCFTICNLNNTLWGKNPSTYTFHS